LPAYQWPEAEVYRSKAIANSKPRQKPQGTIKDPEQWMTGDEPMTGAQDSYLHTLAREAGQNVPHDLTKAEASEKIEELQQKTGRGAGASAKARRTTARQKRG
jgi:hypothetical protein